MTLFRSMLGMRSCLVQGWDSMSTLQEPHGKLSDRGWDMDHVVERVLQIHLVRVDSFQPLFDLA